MKIRNKQPSVTLKHLELERITKHLNLPYLDPWKMYFSMYLVLILVYFSLQNVWLFGQF